MNNSIKDSIDIQWSRIRNQLRNECGEVVFKNWLSSLTLIGIRDRQVCLCAPTRFMRDWIITHYKKYIYTIWVRENGTIDDVEITIPQATENLQISSNNITTTAATVDRECTNEKIGSALDHRYTFDNFVVDKPNEFAYAAARHIGVGSAVSTISSSNPLFLYGGVGLGKTHLLHAMAWNIRECNPNRSVVYLSAEGFMYNFVRALCFKDTLAFKKQLRSVDVLMIDDVQFMSGKGSTQEEFFHTFNSLIDHGSQVIISADRSPSSLKSMNDRLRSRLGGGLVADIQATTYELRLGIIDAKAEQLGIKIPRNVSEFLAYKITSNVRELEGAINRVSAHTQFVGSNITLESTQEVLRDLLQSTDDRRITIEEIQKKVASHFNVSLTDLYSSRRARQVVRPRQIAMYLTKQLTSYSLPEIGRKFGGRDHTTVMYAVKKVEELRVADSSFDEDVELLKRVLET
ncbi:MAG: chromosomal replication initiator protein DnaA [Rhodospirillaceae bacterium]|jgi:chromosomal replication initiator protein|nr:chromosomal replication initiator protein DnaA [Rhodospirillaceae bacterium]